MKLPDMLLQAELVSRWFDGMRVLFIGDGDAIALSVVHPHNQIRDGGALGDRQATQPRLDPAGLGAVPAAAVAVFVGNAWDPSPGPRRPGLLTLGSAPLDLPEFRGKAFFISKVGTDGFKVYHKATIRKAVSDRR